MNTKELLGHVDHTLLTPTATKEDYINLCDEGIAYGVASVCVPPSRVELCVNHVAGKIAVCTVIGFPNGYVETAIKTDEAKIASWKGAKEFDMVIDIGKFKDKAHAAVLADIKAVRAATKGRILKVIIETAYLTQEEKITLCKFVSTSGADYIKTSTGFASGGATFEDVELLRKHVAPHVKVKAAGGIATLDDAYKFISLGADRLGTSKIIKLVQGLKGEGY